MAADTIFGSSMGHAKRCARRAPVYARSRTERGAILCLRRRGRIGYKVDLHCVVRQAYDTTRLRERESS